MGRRRENHFFFNLFLYVFHNEKATNDCITSTVSFDKFVIRPDSICDVNLRRCCSTMLLHNPCSFNKVETPSLYHPSTYLGSSKSFRFPRFRKSYHPCELATTPDKKPLSRWGHRQHPIRRLVVIVCFRTAGQAIMGLPIGNRFRLRSFLVSNPSFRKEQDKPVIRVQY